ncbi:MAG: hypothetical protein ACRC5S_03645 [Cetobacterium sp.]|uniref:hypothetical protein n=1 Tax=Cetobacterium somerae TaxID=188913 RepID=UPI002E7ADDFD|nr:hypothetical protein [Cetobacterium somerae]WVJ03094.1 hypothetical protein VSU16_15290 [Cetobacterium somerae]
MQDFIIEEGKISRKISIKNNEFKNIFIKLESKFKYKNKFIEENYNTSFGILVIENFLVLTEYVLKNFNINVGFKTNLKYDSRNEEYLFFFEIDRFYDLDMTNKAKEEISNYLKTLTEMENDVLNDYTSKIPTKENILDKIFSYCEKTNNIDESIKRFKEENEEVKKSLLDFAILKGLFDVFALNVLKDVVTKDYLLEEEDGR